MTLVLIQFFYLTHFLDGLIPAVQVLVAIQQPEDLDVAYTMALLYEELGDGSNPFNTHHSSSSFPMRAQLAPLPPPPPARWVSQTVEEKRKSEAARDDK